MKAILQFKRVEKRNGKIEIKYDKDAVKSHIPSDNGKLIMINETIFWTIHVLMQMVNTMIRKKSFYHNNNTQYLDRQSEDEISTSIIMQKEEYYTYFSNNICMIARKSDYGERIEPCTKLFKYSGKFASSSGSSCKGMSYHDDGGYMLYANDTNVYNIWNHIIEKFLLRIYTCHKKEYIKIIEIHLNNEYMGVGPLFPVSIIPWSLSTHKSFDQSFKDKVITIFVLSKTNTIMSILPFELLCYLIKMLNIIDF